MPKLSTTMEQGGTRCAPRPIERMKPSSIRATEMPALVTFWRSPGGARDGHMATVLPTGILETSEEACSFGGSSDQTRRRSVPLFQRRIPAMCAMARLPSISARHPLEDRDPVGEVDWPALERIGISERIKRPNEPRLRILKIDDRARGNVMDLPATRRRQKRQAVIRCSEDAVSPRNQGPCVIVSDEMTHFSRVRCAERLRTRGFGYENWVAFACPRSLGDFRDGLAALRTHQCAKGWKRRWLSPKCAANLRRRDSCANSENLVHRPQGRRGVSTPGWTAARSSARKWRRAEDRLSDSNGFGGRLNLQNVRSRHAHPESRAPCSRSLSLSMRKPPLGVLLAAENKSG